jgi:hypothetical protein
MAKLVSALIIGLLLVNQSGVAQSTKPFTSEQLASQTVYRRAVDAAIWGLPLVSLDAMRQAYFRDAKAKYNDIIWWPKGGRLEEPVAYRQHHCSLHVLLLQYTGGRTNRRGFATG